LGDALIWRDVPWVKEVHQLADDPAIGVQKLRDWTVSVMASAVSLIGG
jgi:hypothetical protein